MVKTPRGWAVVVLAALGLAALCLWGLKRGPDLRVETRIVLVGNDSTGIAQAQQYIRERFDEAGGGEPHTWEIRADRHIVEFASLDDESLESELIDSLASLGRKQDVPITEADSAQDRFQAGRQGPASEEDRDEGQLEIAESPDSQDSLVDTPDSGDEVGAGATGGEDLAGTDPSDSTESPDSTESRGEQEDFTDTTGAEGSPTEEGESAGQGSSPRNLGWIAGIVGTAIVLVIVLLWYRREDNGRRQEHADQDHQLDPPPSTAVEDSPAATAEATPPADVNEPPPAEAEATGQALQSLAKEAWRLERVCERMLGRLPPEEQQRYAGRIRWFRKQLDSSLEEVGMRVVSIEGQEFDTGTAATPLNTEDFGPDDKLVVDTMVEPIIMGPDGILQYGTVTLRKAQP